MSETKETPEDAILDADGRPAWKRFAFRLQQQCIGRVMIGVRVNIGHEFEPGHTGTLLELHFEDGGAIGVTIEGDADVGLWITKPPTADGSQLVN